MSETLAQQIDALLPQTQCTRCGYQGCRPYAEAIAAYPAEAEQSLAAEFNRSVVLANAQLSPT